MGRDYAADMRAVLEAETAATEPAPIVAARVVEKLRVTDPDLLGGWLDLNAVHAVRDAITHIDRSVRAHVRGTEGRGVFADAVKNGTVAGWLSDRVKYVISPEGDRKPLRLMTHDELCFVANGYGDSAKAHLMEQAFFTALARKVKTGNVSDHFTEEQVQKLRESIPGIAA